NSDQSPFYFFQNFGAYWDEQNYAKIGYQLEDLFSRLHCWLQQQVDSSRYRICQSLLLIDFLSAQKYYPRKIWWDASLTADQRTMHLRHTNEKQRNHYYNELPTSEKELYKLTRIEEFEVDVQTLLQEGRVVTTKATPYAIYWNPKVEKPVFVKL
ncbi:MAG: DUF4080 domain-containing protein, partial [Bacilli bacterium]